MRRILLCVFFVLCAVGRAAFSNVPDSIDIKWMVDGNLYSQSTCKYGGDVILPTNPTKRGHTFIGWRRNYVELEYLESTGTQYIDTGIVCDDVSNYDMQISFVLQRVIVGNSGQDILGARKDTGNRSFILFVPNNMQGLFLNLAGYSSLNTPLVLSENIIKTGDLFNITAEINQLNNTATVVFNDVLLYENVSWVGDLYCGYSLYLFAVHGDSGIRDPVAAKIYKYRMFKNDVLVLDFIPVLDSYGVPCMYDRVTDSFFYNQGTGQFIAGPVKS